MRWNQSYLIIDKEIEDVDITNLDIDMEVCYEDSVADNDENGIREFPIMTL